MSKCDFCDSIKDKTHSISSGLTVEFRGSRIAFSDRVLPKFFPTNLKNYDQICKECIKFITKFAVFRHKMIENFVGEVTRLDETERAIKTDNELVASLSAADDSTETAAETPEGKQKDVVHGMQVAQSMPTPPTAAAAPMTTSGESDENKFIIQRIVKNLDEKESNLSLVDTIMLRPKKKLLSGIIKARISLKDRCLKMSQLQ